MRVLATPEATSYVRERGGLLFVWAERHGVFGAFRLWEDCSFVL